MSIVIILVLRVYLVFNFTTAKTELTLQQEFHGWDIWANEVEKIAGDRPVVFASSYQSPSKYIYYSRKDAFTFNYMRYRKNQFDLNNTEVKLMDKEVLFMYSEPTIKLNEEINYPLPRMDSSLIMGKWWYYTFINHYRSYNFVPIEVDMEATEFPVSSSIEIPIELINPLGEQLIIKQEEGETWLTVSFVQHGTVMKYEEVENISNLKIDKSHKTVLYAKTPDKAGKYNLWVSIRSGWFPPGLNSRLKKVEITE